MNLIRNILCIILLLPSISLAQDKFITKIAVVDIESIFENSVAINGMKKSISALSNNIQEELSAKETELKVTESELVKEREILGEKEFATKVEEFNKKVSAAQQEMQHKKSALEQSHASALAEVHKNVIEIIAELSKKYSFNIALPSTQILYTDDSLNITPDVIDILNQRLSEVKINYEYKEDC